MKYFIRYRKVPNYWRNKLSRNFATHRTQQKEKGISSENVDHPHLRPLLCYDWKLSIKGRCINFSSFTFWGNESIYMYLHLVLLKLLPSLSFGSDLSIPPLIFFLLFAPLSLFLSSSLPFFYSVAILVAVTTLLIPYLLILFDDKCLVGRAK